jgi:hypothetical protein
MVIASNIFGLSGNILFAAQHAGDAVLERLDPPRRAAVVMALLGLTLIGMFLITFVMVGGHWVRRLARHRPGRRRFVTKAAAEGELREALQQILPEGNSSDTVLLDTSSKDTKIET